MGVDDLKTILLRELRKLKTKESHKIYELERIKKEIRKVEEHLKNL